MALNFTPKGKANPTAPNPANTPTAQTRTQITYGQPAASTARIDALKSKLTGKPIPNPVARRPAGSSARAEEFSKLQKFESATPPPTKPIGQSSARMEDVDLSNIAPPPSGLAPGAQLAQTDTSIEVPKATEATSEPVSPQFVALAKQERAIRKARIELEAQQAAWKREREGFVSKEQLKADALKTLSEVGISYDQLVESQLNQTPPDPNQPLLDKIAELEKKLAGVDERFESQTKSSYDAAVNQIRKDATLLVDSDAAFETIKATGQTEQIVDLIKKVFDAEGEVLPVEEAAKLIEEKLVEAEYKRFETLSKLSKIKARMQPPTESDEATSLQSQPTTTTLSNKGASQRPLTARDRAILAFNQTKA